MQICVKNISKCLFPILTDYQNLFVKDILERFTTKLLQLWQITDHHLLTAELRHFGKHFELI